MERTYNNHLVQVPDHLTSDQRLKPVVRGIVQMTHWQAGGIDHFSREPVSVLHYFDSQKLLPNVKSDPSPVQL